MNSCARLTGGFDTTPSAVASAVAKKSSGDSGSLMSVVTTEKPAAAKGHAIAPVAPAAGSQIRRGGDGKNGISASVTQRGVM